MTVNLDILTRVRVKIVGLCKKVPIKLGWAIIGRPVDDGEFTSVGGGGLFERNFDGEYWRKGTNHEPNNLKYIYCDFNRKFRENL